MDSFAVKPSVHFTSLSNEWSTPQDLFDRLDAEFHFTLDAAATPENAKCDRFFTYLENGLARSWKDERVWLNPPYGADIPKWVEKAMSEPSEVTVMLLPSRTDTRWWSLFWNYETHKPIEGCEVRFLKGRLRFGGGQGKRSISNGANRDKDAPFATAIVVIRGLF